MKTKLTRKDVTQDLIDTVTKYLACRTVAEVTREKVDEVQRLVLENVALYDDLSAGHEGRESERITDPGRSWLSGDEEALERYYDATDKELRARGLKPDDMERDYCPALVAEYDQTKAEWAILDAVAEMLELDFDGQELNSRLLSHGGLEDRQKMLDIAVGLVVNL